MDFAVSRFSRLFPATGRRWRSTPRFLHHRMPTSGFRDRCGSQSHVLQEILGSRTWMARTGRCRSNVLLSADAVLVHARPAQAQPLIIAAGLVMADLRAHLAVAPAFLLHLRELLLLRHIPSSVVSCSIASIPVREAAREHRDDRAVAGRHRVSYAPAYLVQRGCCAIFALFVAQAALVARRAIVFLADFLFAYLLHQGSLRIDPSPKPPGAQPRAVCRPR